MNLYDIYWHIKHGIKRAWSYRSVVSYLNMRCCSWEIAYYDWPKYNPRAHYQVTVWMFFGVYGKGIGYTAMQAARRAIRNMVARPKPWAGQKFESVEDVI